MPTAELYPVTDVLISDYSSLIYEYLLFAKPLILYVPDRREYEDTRGFYTDLSEIPCIMAENEQELPDRVREAYHLYHEDAGEVTDGETEEALGRMELRRTEFIKKYMGSCDGHSTRRIFEKIIPAARAEIFTKAQ